MSFEDIFEVRLMVIQKVQKWEQNETKCCMTSYWRVLKAPPLKSPDLHFSVIKFHCGTYDDNIGPKLPQ